jgi:hypothetical protein
MFVDALSSVLARVAQTLVDGRFACAADVTWRTIASVRALAPYARSIVLTGLSLTVVNGQVTQQAFPSQIAQAFEGVESVEASAVLAWATVAFVPFILTKSARKSIKATADKLTHSVRTLTPIQAGSTLALINVQVTIGPRPTTGALARESPVG